MRDDEKQQYDPDLDATRVTIEIVIDGTVDEEDPLIHKCDYATGNLGLKIGSLNHPKLNYTLYNFMSNYVVHQNLKQWNLKMLPSNVCVIYIYTHMF